MWLRAGLLHPILFVVPWVALCHILAERPGSEINDVAWGFLVIPASAIASFIATAVMAAGRPLTTSERLFVVLLGLIASGIALALGLDSYLEAADVACHGRYECPF